MTKDKDVTKKTTAKKKPATKPPVKKKNGRPAKYDKWLTPAGLKQITAWAREGLYDRQVAEKIGVHRATFIEWQNKFPDIGDALEEGRDYADRMIENAIYRAAMGYEYVEETEVNDGGRDGGKMVLDKRVIKKQPPNVTAAIFWMKNRQPTKWRDKHEIDNNLSGSLEVKVIMDDETNDYSQ